MIARIVFIVSAALVCCMLGFCIGINYESEQVESLTRDLRGKIAAFDKQLATGCDVRGPGGKRLTP